MKRIRGTYVEIPLFIRPENWLALFLSALELLVNRINLVLSGAQLLYSIDAEEIADFAPDHSVIG